MKKRIYVWGNGGGSARFLDRWLRVEDICGFIVSHKEDGELEEFMGKPVITPMELSRVEYDAVIVGSVFVENICRDCKQYGIDESKVVFVYRSIAARNDNFNYALSNEIFGEEVTNLITKTNYVIDASSVEYYDDPAKYGFRCEGTYVTDFVRFRTFELISNEIKENKIPGSVAELGVFRGNFTYYINREFPNRTTYLFDTFEGFEESERQKDTEAGFIKTVVSEAYTNTNIEIVKRKLENFDNVVFKKGYFPDSLGGLEDRFAFVLIDVDLEDPIYNGLTYFFPRMESGGYIMIHDYNSYLGGVKAAVNKYEKEHSIRLKKVPLCDSSGSLVICC